MVSVLKNGVGLLATVATLSGVVACGNDSGQTDRTLELIDSAKTAEIDLGAEHDRLQSLQKISYQEVDAQGNPIGSPQETDANGLGSSLFNHCITNSHNLPRIGSYDYFGDVWSTDESFVLGTEATVNEIAGYVCIGAKLVEVAQASTAPVEFIYTNGLSYRMEPVGTRYYRVPPQSAPVRASLYKEARRWYLRAAAEGIDLLDGGKITTYTYTRGCGQYGCSIVTYDVNILDPSINETQRENLAARLGEAISSAYSGYEMASLDAADKVVAVADSQRGTTKSQSLSAHRVWAGEELSRADAAHMLVGGMPGLQVAGEPSDGFCIHDAMTPGTRRALAALRESGMPVAHINSSTDLTSLIEGLDCGWLGSVRLRLAAKRKDDRLLGTTTVQQAIGASLEDFRLARDYLKQEQRAFGVTSSSSSLALTCTTGGIHPTVTYDLATAMPVQRNDAWFAATARAGLTFNSPWVLQDLAPLPFTSTPAPAELGLAQFYEIFGDRLTHIVSPNGARSEEVHRLAADHMPSLSLTMKHIADTEIGRFWWQPDGDYNVTVGVEMRDAWGTNPLLLVQGHAAAECHTKGTVEGLAQTVCPDPVGQLSYCECGWLGYPYWYGTSINLWNSLWGNVSEPLYVIAPAAKGSGKQILASFKPTTEADFLPGGFASVGIVPNLTEKVGQILKPGKNWCGRPAYECGGKDVFDGRLPLEMPLENELSTDNDGLESSWRYYLDRAAIAAQEADQLGEAYVQSAIEKERDEEADEGAAVQRRSEADKELEVVQEVCGTAVDSQQLMQFISPSGASTTNVIDNRECSTSSNCPNGQTCVAARCTCTTDSQCSSSMECVAGKCVMSRIAIADGSANTTSYQNRLHECLGEDTIKAWVAAGTQGMCFWEYYDTNNPNSRRQACLGSNANAPCPLFVTPEQGTTPCVTALAQATLNSAQRQYVSVTHAKDGLGLFNVGDIIEELRTTQGGRGEFGEIPWNDGMTGAQERAHLVGDLNYLLTHPQLCAAINFGSYYTEGSTTMPSPNQTKTFLASVQSSLDCQYRNLVASLSSRVFANVPDRLMSMLQSNSAVMGAYPAVGGSYGEKLVLMRAALNRYALHGDLIKEEFKSTRDDYETMVKTIEQLGMQHDILNISGQIGEQEKLKSDLTLSVLDLQKDAAVINGVMQMAQAAASADWMNPWSAAGAAAGVVGAALLMDNQLQQLEQQERITKVEAEIQKLQREGQDKATEQGILAYGKELIQARTALRGRAMNIKKYMNEMRTAYEEFDAAMVALESERQRALRALSRGMQSVTTRYTQEAVVDRTLSNITELRQQRYETARKNAVRWAILAKRAIEQRLGVNLAELQAPMAMLDRAPAEWENEICVSTGLSMDNLQQITEFGPIFHAEYVGDYVDKLKRLVESYRIENGFSDGTDQIVMSLKEDVHQVAEPCMARSANLIRMSGDVVSSSNAYAVNAPWEGFACGVPEYAVGFFSRRGDAAKAEALNLCAYAPAGVAHIKQDVYLEPGKYFLSWYGFTGHAAYGFKLRNAAGVALTPTVLTPGANSDRGYPRHYATYSITTAGTYQVYADGVGNGSPGWYTFVGAPSLELITESNAVVASITEFVPLAFEMTDVNGKHEVFGCADTDGSTFRAEKWQRHCVPVCDNGVGTGCLVSIAPSQCYWETSFDLAQRDIERGYILPRGGFAIGNFNYRVEEVAVNFVGTSLRACDAIAGEGCYSQGFIPYSLVQGGPFTVINHAGNAFSSSLYDGHIEHAKGLALERYLSNPLSSADSGLISPFMRKEFMGRPLDGSYVLRVWEEPGVTFEKIEDVQVLLKYRYWTRLN